MLAVGAQGTSRLARYALRRDVPRAERCELCAAPLDDDHPHLLALDAWEVRCACRACAVLFDRRAAAGGRLRRIPDRRVRLGALAHEELLWAAFGAPVHLAFLVVHGGDEVVAYYPSPVGMTRAEVDRSAWDDVVASNRDVAGLEPDVEALLVRQVDGRRRHHLVPIDDCFRLVGILRQHWRGFTGGSDVWPHVDRYFADLDRRARTTTSSTTPSTTPSTREET